jgi:hypothetical protein
MTDGLNRIALARALMLGSSAFQPAGHRAYLGAHGPRVGEGLSPRTVDDLVVRDLVLPDEQAELVRVISETLIAFGQSGRMLTPAAMNATPARILAADLVWFGVERAGQLVGAHGGFFWNTALWVRRFYAILGDPYPWNVDFRLESIIYGHLWDLGMREAMIQLPTGTPNLEARRAAGWQDSHEVHYAGQARPFQWIRRTFEFSPPLLPPASLGAAWQAAT